MNDWIQILSNQWYRTLSIHDITRIHCELNGLSRAYIARSHVHLNMVGSRDKISSIEKKYHQRYHINFCISKYLYYDQQYRLMIDVTGLLSIKLKYYWRVLSIFESWYLKFQKIRTYIWAEHRKWNVTILFQIWSRIIYLHIFQWRTWFILFFLYVVIIHLLRRVEGVEIYCKFIPFWTKLTRAHILFPAQCRAAIQKKNRNTTWRNISKISYSKHPHFN